MKRLLLLCLLALASPAAAAAAPEPVTWCGSDEATANRTPDLELASADRIRFVYAIPADGVDRFADVASGIATDAAWIDGWWRGQDPTRTPRFDRYPFPGCTTAFGGLEIGFVRLPKPASAYVVPSGTARRLDADLAGLFPREQKTVVYYDGRTFDGDVCGETDHLASLTGGDLGIAYVYLGSGCELTPGGGASAAVAAHELIHNLGAVPDEAPHECDTSGSHVCDSATDVMYPVLSPGATLDSIVLDAGRDDYYGHAGSWWDVRRSSWLTHLPRQALSLAVAGAGSLYAVGAGTTELPCRGGCDALQLDDGETVSVTAVPEPGWRLASWTGSCSGSDPRCTITAGGPTTATATFVRAPLRVTVEVRGRGRVRSAPAALDCARTCRASFTGRSVRLTAVASRGWRFAGWSGACTGAHRCTVTATAAVRARFVRRQ